jgi:hypothetical protein
VLVTVKIALHRCAKARAAGSLGAARGHDTGRFTPASRNALPCDQVLLIDTPPSTSSAVPVMKLEASEAR